MPAEILLNGDTQKLKTIYDVHLSAVYSERGVVASLPAEVEDDFLSFGGIQEKVVCLAPNLQTFHLCSVFRLVIVRNLANDCCVISILDDEITVSVGGTVKCAEGEKQWTEYGANPCL